MCAYFGVYYVAQEGSNPRLCEVDGGVCYEAYPTHELAQGAIDEMKWKENYIVLPIPQGVKVYDHATETICISGTHF
jgi:hypothetical protein